jgi:hypothetical protein
MKRDQIQDLAALIRQKHPEIHMVQCAELAIEVHQWLKNTPPRRAEPDALHIAYAENARLRDALSRLISYALTAQSHRTAWLEGLAYRINQAAEGLDDPDRAEACGKELRVGKAGSPSGDNH